LISIDENVTIDCLLNSKIEDDLIKWRRKMKTYKDVESLKDNPPDAIFVLAGGYNTNQKQGGRNKAPAYSTSEADHTGLPTGAAYRVAAGSIIGKAIPNMTLATTSRYVNEPARLSCARVMKDQLIRRGNNPHSILLEENSHSTITNIIEMIKLAVTHKWGRVALLSSDYHIRRIRLMAEMIRELGSKDKEFLSAYELFTERNVELLFISAEDILKNYSPHYAYLINKVHKSERYLARLALEEKGIQDLLDGNYRQGGANKAAIDKTTNLN
jgi:hypothetical protein